MIFDGSYILFEHLKILCRFFLLLLDKEKCSSPCLDTKDQQKVGIIDESEEECSEALLAWSRLDIGNS